MALVPEDDIFAGNNQVPWCSVYDCRFLLRFNELTDARFSRRCAAGCEGLTMCKSISKLHDAAGSEQLIAKGKSKLQQNVLA